MLIDGGGLKTGLSYRGSTVNYDIHITSQAFCLSSYLQPRRDGEKIEECTVNSSVFSFQNEKVKICVMLWFRLFQRLKLHRTVMLTTSISYQSRKLMKVNLTWTTTFDPITSASKKGWGRYSRRYMFIVRCTAHIEAFAPMINYAEPPWRMNASCLTFHTASRINEK